MAEVKKAASALEGARVEIFLTTPLFRFKYILEGQERELLENTVRISGTILEDLGAGVLLKVEILSNLRQTDKELPFDRIFLPYSKIDFMVME